MKIFERIHLFILENEHIHLKKKKRKKEREINELEAAFCPALVALVEGMSVLCCIL